MQNARTVHRMPRPKPPAQLIIVQLLTHEEVTDEAGTYNAVVVIAGRPTVDGGHAHPIHAVPVLGRSPGAVASKLVDLLKELGLVADQPVIVSPPGVDVESGFASHVVSTYRTFTEDLLRDREIAMLEQWWADSPPTAEYDVSEFDDEQPF